MAIVGSILAWLMGVGGDVWLFHPLYKKISY